MNVPDFIEQRLDRMLAHPMHWGDAEAFEMQVLTLFELQLVDRGTEPYQDLVAHYEMFIGKSYPDLGKRPLSCLVDDPIVIAAEMCRYRETIHRNMLRKKPFEERWSDGWRFVVICILLFVSVPLMCTASECNRECNREGSVQCDRQETKPK